ncbi:metallophosphoesterase [Dyadobacter sp. CY323]|uniref:metallophosphoesterase family protein n=1 Tax=Dyadobacter sp. CY323 TaxID=2907302 RepID=UPI001F34CA34|nr:metallophosphoesterase [Dyadobacter sp. CY323]MCE6990150.1 metallophosphoesterase [Dyadobacter sp. CY323]
MVHYLYFGATIPSFKFVSDFAHVTMSIFNQKYKQPVLKKNQPDDTYKFQPLPAPTGEYPYRLDLTKIQQVPDVSKLAFHMLGDTGSIRNPDFQKLVVAEMIKQYQKTEDTGFEPQFLYHLGDVVYNFGEASQYKRQFFDPYERYPGPIFAIPGNHDSDVNPDSRVRYSSLDAFRRVFCDTHPQTVPFSGNAARKSLVQPNVFWTLVTPVANIIGLYCNVPKFGVITPDQRKWFMEELRHADSERPGKAIILCMHHAPYSADVNHGSSLNMIRFLDGVFEQVGIRPDVVFSGHVHNYQRFSKKFHDGKVVPFVVAGGGGYDELHPVANTSDSRFTPNNALFNHVKLENYCDTKHGFLKILIEKTVTGVTITGEFYTLPHEKHVGPEMKADLADRFVIKTGG